MSEAPRLPFADMNAAASPTTACAPPPPPSTDDAEWCWRANSPDVVIGSQPATAVYVNPFGAVVIRQESALGEDDPYVYIQPTFLPQLIAALQRYLPD